ncbi:HalOD1 output domain-containing protein [Halobaculum sp. EA56]|uniref:HalOD1 output domain-containing protein n=1 Tax=Halobaculum sp. EA56 TaxID=3421648 RepID=UPI003EB7F570
MTRSARDGAERDDDPSLDREATLRQAAQRLYDPDRDGGLATAIVFAIADAEGVPPTEVKSPPLYETVDVAGIENTFFDRGTDGRSRHGTGAVEFRYAEYLVRVRSDGWIQVHEPSGTEQA